MAINSSGCAAASRPLGPTDAYTPSSSKGSRDVSPEPGRFILEVPTEADARVQLDSAIATLLPTVAETLDRIGAKHVNAVLIQASAPAVIGDRGLNRFSQTTGLYREHHAGVDPESLIARVQGCFRLM